MKVLITGGAGYIGSHTCKYLAQHGHTVIVYDNLCTGHRHLVKWGAFEYGDIRDLPTLRRVLARHQPDGLIHFASSIMVGESILDPGKYYENNVYGSLQLMQALRDEGVRPLVVSGSAALYGIPEHMPIKEECSLNPINPYGRSKLVMEWMLEDFARAYNLPWVSLRYFNAAGADAEGECGECHDPETHLIPNVLRAILGKIPALSLFGDDYPTPDGTCIRDYVHVTDLASAHMLALTYLMQGGSSRAINLGTGQGISIRQILNIAQTVTGKVVPYHIKPRRAGDPPALIASPSCAQNILGWQAKHSSPENIINTAWQWLQHM